MPLGRFQMSAGFQHISFIDKCCFCCQHFAAVSNLILQTTNKLIPLSRKSKFSHGVRNSPINTQFDSEQRLQEKLLNVMQRILCWMKKIHDKWLHNAKFNIWETQKLNCKQRESRILVIRLHANHAEKRRWHDSCHVFTERLDSIRFTISYPLFTALVIGLTRERFVALGLPSWTHSRTRYWGVFTLQGLKDLLRGFGLWYCKSWGTGENEKAKHGSTTPVVLKVVDIYPQGSNGPSKGSINSHGVKWWVTEWSLSFQQISDCVL